MKIIIIRIVGLLIALTVHEYAHGRVAYFFGDDTAKKMGRLSFNPLKHIDPFWTVLFPLLMAYVTGFPIGMAKPVPVNFMNLHNPKRDMVWVALAGAAGNLLCALFLSALFHALGPVSWRTYILFPIYLNIGLAVFNLIPIPPLDGGRVMMGILPDGYARRFAKIERFGFVIILVLLWSGILSRIVIPIVVLIAVFFQIPIEF